MKCVYFFLLTLLLSVVPLMPRVAAADTDDTPTKVICNVIVFVQRLGLPIMTGVILGAAIMAIFGKLAWAAIVMLVVFTAIFFGASTLIGKFAAGVNQDIASTDPTKFHCKAGGKTESAKYQ